MPRPRTYERSIERTGTTTARFQAGDFGPSGIAEGLETLGRATAQFADRMDEVEDIKARVEANALLVEHAEAARQIGNGVKQTLGMGAEDAAEQGIEQLSTLTKDVLGKASPRARMLLEPQLGQRDVIQKDGFLDHGFGEKVKAFETTAVAANAALLEDAADEPDEAKAVMLLRPVMEKNAERSRFYGHGPDWEVAENRKYVSQFFKSRALKLAIGENGSAKAAIEYANANRSRLSDDDYLDIVNGYNNAALDEVATEFVYGGGEPSATTAGDQVPAGGASDGAPTRALDPVAFFKAFVSPHEGGATIVTDSNGAVAKFGINAAYNPGVDVKNLTEAQAAEIFRKKYFIKSGADKLPPGLAAIHADTFYLNEREAGRILKESGGDPDKYIELRGKFLDGLAAKNPAKYGKYKQGWRNRTKALAEFADRQGGDGTPLPISADTSMTDVTATVMARKDIGLALKQRIIKTIEGKRNDIIQERNFIEGEAQRTLTDAALALGDGFTDIKQLPQDVWLKASPSTRSALTNMADGNKENKPLDPEMAAYINFVEVSDPRRFASKEFRDELVKKGIPTSALRKVAERQGAIAGNLANPNKVDPIADGTLWSIAKEPFEAAGLFFDTVEATGSGGVGGKKKDEERRADSIAKGQAITFVRSQMQSWMDANPGKKPDDKLVKGWVAMALLQRNGQRLYQMDPRGIYDAIPPAERQQIIKRLYGNGPKPPLAQIERDVVAVQLRYFATHGGQRGR